LSTASSCQGSATKNSRGVGHREPGTRDGSGLDCFHKSRDAEENTCLGRQHFDGELVGYVIDLPPTPIEYFVIANTLQNIHVTVPQNYSNFALEMNSFVVLSRSEATWPGSGYTVANQRRNNLGVPRAHENDARFEKSGASHEESNSIAGVAEYGQRT
jgi:hypothetical protein